MDELVYVTCPACGRQIEEPFDAGGGPQAVVHRHSRRRNARLIVVPKEGTVYQVRNTESLERALRREIRRAS